MVPNNGDMVFAKQYVESVLQKKVVSIRPYLSRADKVQPVYNKGKVYLLTCAGGTSSIPPGEPAGLIYYNNYLGHDIYQVPYQYRETYTNQSYQDYLTLCDEIEFVSSVASEWIMSGYVMDLQ